jgi:hypothetical protein
MAIKRELASFSNSYKELLLILPKNRVHIYFYNVFLEFPQLNTNCKKTQVFTLAVNLT